MADQMFLVLTPAAEVAPGDLCWRIDDLYRVHEVDREPLTGRVHIHLEACRYGPLHLSEIALVPIEKLS